MMEMIGYCGYNCHLCAARSDDPAVRQRLVDGWKKYFGHQHYTAENVHCCGCLGEGHLADQECQARPCARQRGVSNCAFCDDFPCDKVRHLLATRDGMLVFLSSRMADLTPEEHDLCLRQFDSMPNLVRFLAQAGKLPAWLGSVPPPAPRTGMEDRP